MAKKAPPVTIIEFVTQEEIDHLLESAFIEEAEAADELELELSDLAQASAFDTAPDEDPGLISNDEIEALLKGAIPAEKSASASVPSPAEKSGSKGAIEKAAETDDFSDIVNQSDIDALLRGTLEEFSSPKPAEDDLKSDNGGLVSADDIDQILKEAIAAETGAASGEGGITQSDLDALLNDVDQKSEKESDDELIRSFDGDLLLSGAEESAVIEPVVTPKKPSKPSEGADILSQTDLDALLMAEIGGDDDLNPAATEETAAEDGADKQEGIVQQSAIDDLLAESLVSGPETKPAPDPVILAADSGEVETSSESAESSPSSRPWYTKRVLQVSVAAVLLLAVSTTVGVLKWRSAKSPEPQSVVLHFPIPGPDAKASALAEPIRTNISLQGFLILAPVEKKGLTGLSTDVLLGFTDSVMADIIKDKEPYIRNIIYGVLHSALKSAGDKPPSEADLTLSLREAIERVIPKESIRSVLLDKFETI